MSPRSSPYAACFRRSPSPLPPPPPPPPAMSSAAAHFNVTTSIYETPAGSFSLTWSRSLFSRSVVLHSDHRHSSSAAVVLRLNPLAFWKKSGSKTLSPSFRLFWDFSRARFGSSPEPRSGFYLALLHHAQIILLVGDLAAEAYSRTKAQNSQNPQLLVLKREQVIAHKIYSTKATIAGRIRDIRIDCGYNDDSRLCFAVDGVEVLEIKHLKWKFRGNEKIEVEGVPVQISWDVFNWVFAADHHHDAHAIFMFRFDQHKHDTSFHNTGIESGRMSSSVSMSSVGSSVLDWASVEESDLGGGPSAFSLLVYAWKK